MPASSTADSHPRPGSSPVPPESSGLQSAHLQSLEPVVLTDPRAIKALAHPARLAVIDEFFSGRRLTATECAEIAGLSASAMSYHLRALEKWGIIRRSEATEDGRERPWEAAGSGLRVQSSEPRATSAGETLLIDRILDRQRREIDTWLHADESRRGDWDDAMTISGAGFWLTLDETKQLTVAIQQQLDQFDRRANDDLPEGARQVRINLTIVPTLRA